VCAQQGGTLVDTCPTSGQLGCCTFSAGAIQATACYYCGTTSAAIYEQACSSQGSGMWTPGPGCGG
jgi:hypothetical protein